MITSILGLIIGIASILLGQMLEGGHIETLLQPTAAMIVFGGTLGATMLSTSVKDFSASLKSFMKGLIAKEPDMDQTINEVMELATEARKNGILALENQISTIRHPFLAKNLRFIVDGYDPEVLREMMEDTMDKAEAEKMAAAKVYETAGGFSPTIGIIGAVLGLIHVMGNLSDSSKLGAGIAVAFVATVYGVGAANLVLLPLGNRLKSLANREMIEFELMYTGLMGIQSGLNPRVIEARLKNIVGKSMEDGAESAEQRRAA